MKEWICYYIVIRTKFRRRTVVARQSFGEMYGMHVHLCLLGFWGNAGEDEPLVKMYVRVCVCLSNEIWRWSAKTKIFFPTTKCVAVVCVCYGVSFVSMIVTAAGGVNVFAVALTDPKK